MVFRYGGASVRKSITIIIFVFSSVFSKTNPDTVWYPFGTAWERAAKTGKPLMVYIYSRGCGWCTRFEKNTLQNTEVQKYINDYFIRTQLSLSSTKVVEFKGEKYPERDIGASFGVRGTPATIFLFIDTVGNAITKLPGYVPPEQFIYIIKAVKKYVEGKWYKDLNFGQFLESERRKERTKGEEK